MSATATHWPDQTAKGDDHIGPQMVNGQVLNDNWYCTTTLLQIAIYSIGVVKHSLHILGTLPSIGLAFLTAHPFEDGKMSSSSIERQITETVPSK